MDYLLSIYGCMFLLGAVCNTILGLTLCCSPGAKARSPLLFGLIVADLLVCCLSGPVTAALYVITPWTHTWLCIARFAQVWPVSASTLSMMAISVDRYLTVKNYRPANHVTQRRNILSFAVASTWIIAALLSCPKILLSHPWRSSLMLTHIILAHIIPAFAVFVSHLGVHAKLTALSLTARAKHGELPLPMPILRRPMHVIIVAGIPKQQHAPEDIVEANDPQPPASTLRSRRRLANSLLWVATLFSFCWLPYVVCELCIEFGSIPPVIVQQYCLLIGHMHSAISPILYYSLNHQWPQKPCKMFKMPVLYRSASSTNEAALGPFHPRLVRPPPLRPCSSQYLY